MNNIGAASRVLRQEAAFFPLVLLCLWSFGKENPKTSGNYEDSFC